MPVSGMGWDDEPEVVDDEDWGCGAGGGGSCREEVDVGWLPTDAPGGGREAFLRYSEILSA